MFLSKLLRLTLVLGLLGTASLRCEVSLRALLGINKILEEVSENKDSHPFLGWFALKNNLIYNLRFNGNFNYSPDGSINDKPLDNVSKLIKFLFPSPTGELSSFTTADINFGNSIKEKPEVVALMLHLVKAVKSGDQKRITEAREAFLKARNFSTMAQDKKLVAVLESCAWDSVSKAIPQKDDNNKKGIKYPAHLVEHIIMSFFCKNFSTRKDVQVFIKKLCAKDLGEGMDLTGDLENYIFSQIDNVPSLPYQDTDSDLSYGLAHLYTFNGENLDLKPFSDCVESSVRQLLNLFIFNKESQEFDLDSLKEFVKKKAKKIVFLLKNYCGFMREH